MAAIEDGLRLGPLHIVKHNRPSAVVLPEDEYLRLTTGKSQPSGGVTAMQWLLQQQSSGQRSKSQIDAALKSERDW